MMRFARTADRDALRLLVLHDDPDREFDYVTGAEDALDRARERAWTVVSVKDDWDTGLRRVGLRTQITESHVTLKITFNPKGAMMAAKFGGLINVDIRDSVPDWTPFEPVKAPDGAPNVVYIVLDDVGFSAMSCYGGPIETPNIDRIAPPVCATASGTPRRCARPPDPAC